MMIWPPAAFIFYLVASLGALAVDGSILSPSEFQEVALQTLARHATSEKQMRDFASTHSSFTSIFAACDNSSSTMQPTTYSALECACGCGGWKMDFSSSSTFCSYQSFTEAVTACYSSDATDDCQTYCSRSETAGFFETYDCLWSLDHALYWSSGVCSDSLDSTNSEGCKYVNSGSVFYDNDTIQSYWCDIIEVDAGFPTTSALLPLVYVANAFLAVFAMARLH
mmetsp:Transcript_50067/g.86117  ORF Transcript_50067/g.86117 Transcript_50067/m.86117 type:complete len:224 (+) Transcript_50067:27-698(+)